MARKPRDELSPAYRRRLERREAEAAKRAGWSEGYRKRIERGERKARAAGVKFNKQKARGKQAGEHIIRKAREEAMASGSGVLTSAQRSAIAAFANRQAGRAFEIDSSVDAKRMRDAMQSYVLSNGWDAFKAVRAATVVWHRQREVGAVPGVGWDGLVAYARELLVPDVYWLFYH